MLANANVIGLGVVECHHMLEYTVVGKDWYEASLANVVIDGRVLLEDSAWEVWLA